MAVRTVAINQFSLNQIPTGQPHSVLEDVFVPIYYLHRYQTEAATKMLGGSLYDYSIKGAKSALNKAVSPADQRHALSSVLNTLSPLRLHIPERVEALFPPRAFGHPRTRESFKSAMGLNFDPVTAAGSAASMTLDLLFHPARLNRIYWQQVSDPNQLSLDELLEKSAQMFNTSQASDRLTTLNEYVLNLYIRQVMAASVDKQSLPQVKSKLKDHLFQWERWAKKYHKDMAAHYLDLLNQYWQSPEDFDRMETPDLPDGSPIGTDLCLFPQLD